MRRRARSRLGEVRRDPCLSQEHLRPDQRIGDQVRLRSMARGIPFGWGSLLEDPRVKIPKPKAHQERPLSYYGKQRDEPGPYVHLLVEFSCVLRQFLVKI